MMVSGLTAVLEKQKRQAVSCHDYSLGFEKVCQISYLSLQPNVDLNSARGPEATVHLQ